ncbi:AAA+ ATPase domain-containing protein [Candidatus Magnetomoraceae bacterium gMMP-1]
MKFFNTAGPVKCDIHYCLPPLERFDLQEVLMLIAQQKYFVLHAPRQTGKTSAMLELMKYLNEKGQYDCLYMNVEAAQGARENVEQGMNDILRELASRAKIYLNETFPYSMLSEFLDSGGYGSALNQCLTEWPQKREKPLVLLIDEIDSLIGDTLISVLRQIRSGYDKRPAQFPQSIVLCGVREVKDYRIHSSREKEIITGGSAFNIKAESLHLGNFNLDEIKQLYQQHTDETGQKFNDDIYSCIWDLTGGQPWLVNALAYEVCFKMKEGRNREKPITLKMIKQAKENLISRRETHLDQLSDKLQEDRVKRIIAPILEGTNLEQMRHDDIEYLIDLGLIKKMKSGLVISNGIYREIIPRELTQITQYNLEPIYKSDWYVNKNRILNMNKLISNFQEFFRENSEIWLERFDYKEAAPQLLMQAFLQRIVNSGGQIFREYGLGRQRTDILIEWPVAGKLQKYVIELKIRYGSLEKTIQKGLEQTWKYMDKCGSTEGHLVIFDRSKKLSWDEKIFSEERDFKGQKIMVWGTIPFGIFFAFNDNYLN